MTRAPEFDRQSFQKMDHHRKKHVKKKMRKFTSRRNKLSSAAKCDLSAPSNGFDVSMATNLFEESITKNLNWDNDEGTVDITEAEAAAGDDENSIFLFPDVHEMEGIRDKFESGVKVSCRKRYLRGKAAEYVFTGHDAVSFLLDNAFANTRENALTLGRMLSYEFALFTHVTKDYDLEDESHLYKFIPRDQREIFPSGQAGCPYSMKYIAEAFEEGIEVSKNTFVGRDAVTFLVTSNMAKTRQDAVRIGQILLQQFGLFEHVSKKHSFKDKRYTYKFVPQKHRTPINNIGCRESISIEELSLQFKEVVKPSNEAFQLQHYTFSGESAIDAVITAGLVTSRSEAINLGQRLVTQGEIKCIQGGEKAFFDRPAVYYCYCETSLQWLGSGNDGPSYQSLMYEVVEEECEIVDEDLDLLREGNEEANKDELDKKRTDFENGENDKDRDESDDNCEVCDDYSTDSAGRSEADLPEMNVEKLIQDIAGGNLHEFSDDGSCYDKFGFIVEDASKEDGRDANALSESGASVGRRKSQESSETVEPLDAEGWNLLLDSCALTLSGESPEGSQETLKYYMRLGLPDSLRGRAWSVISAVNTVMDARDGDYQSIVEEATLRMESKQDKNASQIERDLRRTFPSHYLFRSNSEEEDMMNSSAILCEDLTPDGIEALRRILYAYSIYDDEIGYCQGMNFIAAMFLTFLPEEESFWLLVAIMNDDPYSMRELFTKDMSGSLETLFVADRLVRKLLPDLHQHLTNEGINISMYACQWLMTIFSSNFNFDLVSKVWDNFLVEGWKVVYRVFIAILAECEEELLNLPFEHILTFLRDKLPGRVDGQSILAASLAIRLRSKHIRKYTKEFRLMQSGEHLNKKGSPGPSGTNVKHRGKKFVQKLSKVGITKE
mmetsp:Transcript_30024/g.46504  ORF Transcript_30024/g.46504 Transcript_30024/m.46504 type:complete len:893 (+) Transcript_30024:11-2689(+)